jgi:hypothetical protein
VVTRPPGRFIAAAIALGAAGAIAVVLSQSSGLTKRLVAIAPVAALDVDRPFGLGHVPPLTFRWPVKPFDRAHVLRATFGEPRGLSEAGGPAGAGAPRARYLASIGQISAVADRSLHNGVDIVAPDGTPVYALQSGIAKTGGGTGYDGNVIVGSFGYWHLANTVATGSRVEAFTTVLGTVYPGQRHVHLTRYTAAGRGESADDPVNPLLGGGLTPYSDTRAPVVGALIAFDRSQAKVPIKALKGPVVLAVNASDVQSAGGTRTGVYSMGYRLRNSTGTVVLGPVSVFEFQVLPAAGVADRLYTVASTRHTFVTRFWYRISDRAPANDGFLHTERFAPGAYRLEVSADDARGNVGRRTYPIRIVGS